MLEAVAFRGAFGGKRLEIGCRQFLSVRGSAMLRVFVWTLLFQAMLGALPDQNGTPKKHGVEKSPVRNRLSRTFFENLYVRVSSLLCLFCHMDSSDAGGRPLRILQELPGLSAKGKSFYFPANAPL